MPVKVNTTSIRNKLMSYMKSPQYKEDMKDRISQLRRSGSDGDEIGLDIISQKDMEDALNELIGLLQVAARDLPTSVGAHLTSAYSSDITFANNDSGALARVSMGGDLYRPSLIRKDGSSAEGINDIVMLFDQGYSASKRVVGYWHAGDAEMVVSRQNRPAMMFMEEVIDIFNGSKYGAFAHASLG